MKKSKKTKKEKNEKKQNYLYFVYQEESSGGEICEGQEDDDWPSYETTYSTINDLRLHSKTMNHYGNNSRFWSGYDQVPYDGNPLEDKLAYIVYVVYSSGGTFGSSSGNIKAIKAFKNKEDALKIMQDIKNGGDGGLGYKPWEGFFESLERIEMDYLPII